MLEGFDRVAVVGLGLMGGSLCLGLRRHGFKGTIAGCARRAGTRADALEKGLCDEVHAAARDAVAGANAVVLCLPVQSIVCCALDVCDVLEAGALVTDVGSTKQHLHGCLDEPVHAAGAHFVGSHPVCGSEQSGIGAARADLYEGADVIITRTARTAPEAVERAGRLWQALGARLVEMSPEAHDAMLARTSHLPHLVSSVVARVAARGCREGVSLPRAGTGLRDMTRLAAGSPPLWRDIVRTNRGPILRELEALQEELARLQACIQTDDASAIEQYLADARADRGLFFE